MEEAEVSMAELGMSEVNVAEVDRSPAQPSTLRSPGRLTLTLTSDTDTNQ